MPQQRKARIFLFSVAVFFGGLSSARADDVPALQIVEDVAKPGAIVPAEPPVNAKPAQPAPPAQQITPPPVAAGILSGATAFPVTQKLQSDTINPGVAQTAPVPAPDVAASITQPAPPIAPARNAPAKASPENQRVVKQTAKKRPVKPPSVPKARPPMNIAPPLPEAILTHRPAGPKMPSVKPGMVVTEPLNDPLANQLLSPDKKALVQAIEAKANGQAAPKDISAPDSPVSSRVKIPAENLNGALVTAAVPHVAAPGEKAFVALPFKAGVTTLDAATVAQLQVRILPPLLQNNGWRLHIDAYASAVNDEPLNARRIALSRALAIRAWLLDHGAMAQRLDLRAQGPEAGHNPADQTDLLFMDGAAAR